MSTQAPSVTVHGTAGLAAGCVVVFGVVVVGLVVVFEVLGAVVVVLGGVVVGVVVVTGAAELVGVLAAASGCTSALLVPLAHPARARAATAPVNATHIFFT